jgi:hypothetical protein
VRWWRPAPLESSVTCVWKSQSSNQYSLNPYLYIFLPFKPLFSHHILQITIYIHRQCQTIGSQSQKSALKRAEEVQAQKPKSSEVNQNSPKPNEPDKQSILPRRFVVITLRILSSAANPILQVSGSGTYQQVAKIDYTDDIIKPKTVGTQVGDAIKKARSDAKNDKGQAMTQKDLAQKINQTPQIVADFERGSAKPDEQILGNMERVLKVILRGKNIGQPKTYGKKNAAT